MIWYWKGLFPISLVSARDGKVLWFYDGPTTHMHSKGMIGDVDPTHEGMELYAGEQNGSQYWLYAANGTRISDKSFGTLSPLAIWWDDDVQKKVVVDGRLFKYPGSDGHEDRGSPACRRRQSRRLA